MSDKPRIPLTEEDIIDLYEGFVRLRDFIEDLSGILWDNTELPENIRGEIESLYAKKF